MRNQQIIGQRAQSLRAELQSIINDLEYDPFSGETQQTIRNLSRDRMKGIMAIRRAISELDGIIAEVPDVWQACRKTVEAWRPECEEWNFESASQEEVYRLLCVALQGAWDAGRLEKDTDRDLVTTLGQVQVTGRFMEGEFDGDFDSIEVEAYIVLGLSDQLKGALDMAFTAVFPGKTISGCDDTMSVSLTSPSGREYNAEVSA